MYITAIMCTRNRAEQVGRAVESVLTNEHPDFEMVIVDQSDTDDTRLALESLIASHPNLTYIHTLRVGLSAAYNSGIAQSKGDLLAFTDDDCVAPPDWLRRIEDAFVQNPDAFLLYGQVLIPSELHGVPGIVPELAFRKTRCIGPRTGFQVIGMGANFAARRQLFEAIGGFDEVLGGGGPLRSSQDFDLQYRVYRAGLETLLEPTVRVDHYGLRSSVDWPKTLAAYGIGDGGFYMKHVRCGDRYAAWLLARRFARVGPASFAKVLLRRPSRAAYATGMVRGVIESYRFDVDRKRRLYLMSSAH